MRGIDHDARYKTMLFSKILGVTFNYSADNFCFDLSFALPIGIRRHQIFLGGSSDENSVARIFFVKPAQFWPMFRKPAHFARTP